MLIKDKYVNTFQTLNLNSIIYSRITGNPIERVVQINEQLMEKYCYTENNNWLIAVKSWGSLAYS